MPVDRGTGFLMGIYTDFGGLGIAIVPCLDDAVIGAKGKFDAIFGRPRDISDTITLSHELLAAVAYHHLGPGVSEVPKSDRGILASGQEHKTQEGTYRKAMHLAVVLMKPSDFNSRTVEIVKDHLAIGSSSGDVIAELTMGPLDVMNI